MAALVKTPMLVPETDNDGLPFLPSAWRDLEERLLALGGYSRLGDVSGVWPSGAHLYRDTSRQYVVALDSWMRLPAWLDVVLWARQAFRQEALYIEVQGIPEIISDV